MLSPWVTQRMTTKPDPNLSEVATAFLQRRADNQASVWVTEAGIM